ncbi:MAG: c-type cytochrome [Pseudomonadota bacterium]|nr:c-type cytochrome [Pseudomonadota bacterium]
MSSLWRLLGDVSRRAWGCLADGPPWRVLCRLVMMGLMVAGLGVLFVALGLVSIAADRGHWPLTEDVLRITMNHTVRMRTLRSQAPALDQPALVLKGAGHYATGCMPCHGAPGQDRSLLVFGMVPEPPVLSEVVPTRDPSELFWVVKHGLRYTAMPAWPSQQRDDEVWAVVAFLHALPGMSPARYRELAYGPLSSREHTGNLMLLDDLIAPPMSTLDNCARCHGEQGEGRGTGAFPKLAGQSEAYLLASLQAFARGERHSGVMEPIAASLDPATMQALARHYAGLGAGLPKRPDASMYPIAGAAAIAAAAEGESASGDLLPASPTRGAILATRGLASERIPACQHCHGPDATVRNPLYPRLAGQYPQYLALQLHLFQQERRGGTPYHRIMQHAASSMSARQIEDLAAYCGQWAGDPVQAVRPGLPSAMPPPAESVAEPQPVRGGGEGT